MKGNTWKIKGIFWTGMLLLAARTGAQTDPCKNMQAEKESLQEKIYSLATRIYPAENFKSLMELAHIDEQQVKNEIALTEAKLKSLTAAVSKGDTLTGKRELITEYNERLGLMKKRLSKTLTNSQYFAQPLYKQQLQLLGILGGEVAEINTWITRIDGDRKSNNCPDPVAPATASPEKKEVKAYWEGDWHYEESIQKMDIRFRWKGDTAKASGVFDPGRVNMNSSVYTFDSLQWDGANSIRGYFTGTVEDAEKFIDAKGTVLMTLTGRKMTTVWTETEKLTLRWKPGQAEKPALVRNPLPPYTLVFTKQ